MGSTPTRDTIQDKRCRITATPLISVNLISKGLILLKVVMIGTPNCTSCKRVLPRMQKYCETSNIEFEYTHLADAPQEMVDILFTNNIRKAPAFILVGDKGSITVTTEDTVFEDLDSLRTNS